MKKIILCTVVLVGLLFLVGCQEIVYTKEKALLTTMIDSYYINEYNENEIFFSYSIINYGYEEAKNVEVECILYDRDDNVILRKRENVGNIASTSTKYDEIYAERPKLDEEGLYGPGCYIISCDNCEVLPNRLPEFNKTIKKYFS